MRSPFFVGFIGALGVACAFALAYVCRRGEPGAHPARAGFLPRRRARPGRQVDPPTWAATLDGGRHCPAGVLAMLGGVHRNRRAGGRGLRRAISPPSFRTITVS